MIQLLMLAGFTLSARAVTLPEISAAQLKSLPVNTSQPRIPCDQIPARLAAYDQMAREHDLSVSSFLNEVTNKVNEWYQLLAPFEGSQRQLPQNLFLPLQDGAGKITQVADLAFENSGLLANEMDRIKSSLAECVLTPK